jgi:hypothetical protein
VIRQENAPRDVFCLLIDWRAFSPGMTLGIVSAIHDSQRMRHPLLNVLAPISLRSSDSLTPVVGRNPLSAEGCHTSFFHKINPPSISVVCTTPFTFVAFAHPHLSVCAGAV